MILVLVSTILLARYNRSCYNTTHYNTARHNATRYITTHYNRFPGGTFSLNAGHITPTMGQLHEDPNDGSLMCWVMFDE